MTKYLLILAAVVYFVWHEQSLRPAGAQIIQSGKFSGCKPKW